MTDEVPKSDLDIWGREDIKKHCPACVGVTGSRRGLRGTGQSGCRVLLFPISF